MDGTHRGDPMNIIYIDDDATNRTVVQGMLAAAGLSMAEAADARTGLRMVDENDYSLVVMDLRMPEMNGLTAIRQLRVRTDHKGRVPILVLTADLTPGVCAMCRSAGANSFLEKPVSMEQLFDVIGTIMVGNKAFVLN